MSTMRIDKFLSHSLGISRKDIKRYVRARRVTLDGQRIRSASVMAEGEVRLDGVAIPPLGREVWALNKIPGLLSATQDPSERTVIDHLVGEGPFPWPKDEAEDPHWAPWDEMDLIEAALWETKMRSLSPVGRLDKDTTGLLLLTNDGQLLHRLTHPKYEVSRTYEIVWEGELAEDAVARVAEGVVLGDGTVCAPAVFERVGPQEGVMRVTQGMYHQVKRMIGALGGRVSRLHRTHYGELGLDGLGAGEARPLTDEEVRALDPGFGSGASEPEMGSGEAQEAGGGPG